MNTGCIIGLLLFSMSFCCLQDAGTHQGTLSWRNGDKAPGHIVSADPVRLRWQATSLFRDPLNLDVSFLKQIDFDSDGQPHRTNETFAIQTTDGFSLYGTVTKLDDSLLHFSSSRCGTIEVDRSRIATILNLQTSGSLIHGEFDLNNWDANRGEKKYWTVNDQGELESERSNVHLFLKSELPDSALIELELQWTRKLDFTFGFGVPHNSRNIETLPRLESWDDSIVLSYNDDFEIVQEQTDNESRRLKFLMHWNRTTNQIVIHDEQGRPLASADLGNPPTGTEPGIYIENKSGDLRVSKLTVRRSAEGFDATKPSIQTLDEAAINGQVLSFDGSDWTISTSPEADLSITVPADQFCGAFLVNPSIERPSGQTRLNWFDGMFVGGKLDSIEDDRISLTADFALRPLSFELAGASKLRFDASEQPPPDAKFDHRLFNKAGEVRGRLEPGSGEADDILRWRVAGAEEPVPFAVADARIVLRKQLPDTNDSGQWADTLYLVNRDTIPCRVVSIDEQRIQIESFTENNSIEHRHVKAIEFGNQSNRGPISPTDKEWVIPKKSRSRVKVANEKMEIAKDAEFGHPSLFATGGFEFELAWPAGKYGVLECQSLIGNLDSREGGKKLNILFYADQMFVGNQGDSNPARGMITVPKNKAKVAFKIHKNNLVVSINGRQAYSEAIPSDFHRGRGARFKLSDPYQQDIACTLSNVKLTLAGSVSGSLVDPRQKELLLTIPRLKKNSPPKQILCAENMDMVRGEVISLDEQFVRFRAGNEEQRFPRDVVTGVVWLHAENLDGSGPAFQPEDSADTVVEKTNGNHGRQTVQVLMQGGRRMTSTLQSWSGETLTGGSPVLGRCEIPFDQIRELRFGSFATEATDLPYADWSATLAPAPVMETGAGSETTFGGSSPLIGTVPKSFTVSLIDGSKVSLTQQLGKVVVLDFWATWCGPCVKALPEIAATLESYPADQIVFLAINQGEDLERIQSFLESRQLQIPVALDSGKIGKQFQVESLPQTVIIDTEGRVAFVSIGITSDHEAKLRAAIDKLLPTIDVTQ